MNPPKKPFEAFRSLWVNFTATTAMPKNKTNKSISGSESVKTGPQTKTIESTKSSEHGLNGSRTADPLRELAELLDAGLDDERTSVIVVPAPPHESVKSIVPKVPDTWPMRIVASTVALGIFGKAVMMLLDLLKDLKH